MTELGFEKFTNNSDIFQTSTGVGHHWRPGYYFPDSTYQGLLNEKLPNALVTKDEVTPEERFQTTYGTQHNPKYPSGAYEQDLVFKKPPGHWKVNYVKDFLEKMDKGNFRRPLDIGNMKTETQDKFSTPRALPLTGPTVEDFSLPKPKGPRPFLLNDHLTDGPTKELVASTQNEQLRGRPFFVRDKGVLNLNDMYLTTSNRVHRSFKPDELDGYPRKDATTYWECEDYTKAWGHANKDNPVPSAAVPREALPMRNTAEPGFRFATKDRNVPRRQPFVPYTGLRTETQDKFQVPTNPNRKWDFHCPVDAPWLLPDPTPPVPFSAPAMYKTEYQNVGSEKPITLTGL